MTIVRKPPQVGLWDPFQMACSWLRNGGDPNHNSDDPPSIPSYVQFVHFGMFLFNVMSIPFHPF